MIGIVFLVLFLVFLLFVMLISFLARRHPIGFGVFIVSGICVYFILVTNLDFLSSPRTKRMVFKVVDAETQKPVPNARVVIGWAVHYATIASSQRCYYKVERTVSDVNGEFEVPPALKTINLGVLGFYKQRFSGVDIGVFDYGANCQPAIFTVTAELDNNINLARIHTVKELVKSITTTYKFLENTNLNCKTGPTKVNQSDIIFFKSSYANLERLFPGKLTDSFENGYEMSQIFDKLHQPEAYIILNSLLEKHKDNKSGLLSSRLERYRKLYKIKEGNK